VNNLNVRFSHFKTKLKVLDVRGNILEDPLDFICHIPPPQLEHCYTERRKTKREVRKGAGITIWWGEVGAK
jgi:hypothetical protein